jgi:hypothetical protein
MSITIALAVNAAMIMSVNQVGANMERLHLAPMHVLTICQMEPLVQLILIVSLHIVFYSRNHVALLVLRTTLLGIIQMDASVPLLKNA